MAPLRRKKLSTTPPPDGKPVLSAATPRLSPSKLPANTPARLRSPIRKVHGRGLSSPQRRVLVENLKLEMNERVRRLRAQYEVQAQALRRRIEMRINRVPKKLWNAKMGELLLQHARAQSIAPAKLAAPVNAKVFVEDVKRLSGGSSKEKLSTTEALVVQKRKLTKKVSSSTISRTDIPPMHHHHSAHHSSPAKSRPLSPVKRVFSPPPLKDNPRKISPLQSSQLSNTDLSSTSAPDTSINGKTSGNISRSNVVKRALKTMPPPASVGDENTRHYLKNITSSGSLKENKVEGIKDKLSAGKTGKTATSNSLGSAGGRRVLRQRK